MKEGRVILVLLSIILLFSVILGIKIWKNTPEKQLGQAINTTITNTTINDVEIDYDTDKTLISVGALMSGFIMRIIGNNNCSWINRNILCYS